MNKIKAIIFLSIVSFFLILSIFFPDFQIYFLDLKLLGLLSAILGIVSYLYSIFEERIPVKKQIEHIEEAKNTKEIVKEIKDYQKEEISKRERELSKYKSREGLIRILMNYGTITFEDIYSLNTSKKLTCVISYGEGLEKNIKDKLKRTLPKAEFEKISKLLPKKAISSDILEEMGFIKCLSRWTIYINFVDKLPKKYRNVEVLRKIFDKEFEKRWEEIKDDVLNGVNAKDKEKVVEILDSHKVTYFMFMIESHEFLPGYIKRYSFTPQFVDSLYNRLDYKKSREVFNKKRQEIINVIKKVSILDLLPNLPLKVKDTLQKFEGKIKSNININTFLNYADFTKKEKLAQNLNNYLPTQYKNLSENYAKQIIEIATKYKEELIRMEVILK